MQSSCMHFTFISRHYSHKLTAEQRQQDEWDPSNTGRYEVEFWRIHVDRVRPWDGHGPVPHAKKNTKGRYAFWGVPGRSLDVVLAHIASGGKPLETLLFEEYSLCREPERSVPFSSRSG